MAKPFDVTDADFDERVLRRSEVVPVLVDFWADWCQPCHMLAPVIEKAVAAHDGKIELAKLDVDANQATAARYGVRGLPTGNGLRDRRRGPPFPRARLAGEADLAPAFEAWDEGDHATALELLQAALADPERRDLVRRVMVAIFTDLGPDHPLAREHRRRLSAALN